MRVRVPGTMLAVLALIGLGAGCATQVHAQGKPDPAMVVSTESGPTGTPTDSSTPSTTPSATLPPPTVNPATERRITCLLVTPSIGTAITAWNNYVDKKAGTRTSVATQLTSSATTIDGVLRTSRLGVHDVVRGWALKVSQTLKSMAGTLRGGGTPSVTAFNSYKTKLQQACSG
jgi:hypothetical protein